MLAALAALVLAITWWVGGTSGEPRGIDRDTPTHSEAERLVERVDAGAVAPPSEPPAEPPASAVVEGGPSVRRPDLAPGAIDPCGSGEDDPPIDRPDLNELLQLRIAELNDHMRAALASPHASDALRRGWAAALDPAHESEALGLLQRAPDRASGGFDTYVAVAVVLASRALGTDTARAIRYAELAERAGPDDPLPLVIDAIAHERRTERAAARDRLVRAHALDPEEPAIAWALAWRLEDAPDARAALEAFDAYLAAVPDDRAAARRRARMQVRASTFEGATLYTQGGLTLVATPALPREQAMHALGVVQAGLSRGASLLGVPQREELTIFVHPSGDAMRRATCTQAWTGAVFDGALETDVETLAAGRHGETSLAHEAFHASIHPAVPNVPTWLDEGLAEYASGEERPSLLRSYELMVREHTWIPFATMNDAFLVIDDGTDAGLAYDQALAMVEWLVDRRGERGIRDAAAWLIGGGDPARVLAEAAHGELDGETLLAFVGRRAAAMRAPARP
ncbi:MAG: hypothetical protein U0234_23940 [Sandaracinus sp.]